MGYVSAEIGCNQPDSRRNLLRFFVTSRMPQPADVFTMNVALAIAHLKQPQQSQLNTEQSIVSLKGP
jgi:hypothetical protein